MHATVADLVSLHRGKVRLDGEELPTGVLLPGDLPITVLQTLPMQHLYLDRMFATRPSVANI